jgi:diguanylate cyclase (GGDEF)-like protein
VENAAADRLVAARDRAEAALDRQHAALDRRRAAEYLARAYRDGLTGALQRDPGRDRLQQELDRSLRTGTTMAIAFLDVVGLREINDQGGHSAGDAVLRALGEALTERVRTYDLVVRWGGDEFVCALPGSTVADARRRLDEVRVRLAEQHPGARFTVGLAAVAQDETLQMTIDRADREVYAARRAGGSG